MIARSWKDWADKLDSALWTYYMAFKTSISTAPYRLVYGNSCHLPVELEDNAFSDIEFLNFYLRVAEEKRLLQLNELEKILSNAYESSKIYKDRMKS